MQVIDPLEQALQVGLEVIKDKAKGAGATNSRGFEA
jgi:hypothetical protein